MRSTTTRQEVVCRWPVAQQTGCLQHGHGERELDPNGNMHLLVQTVVHPQKCVVACHVMFSVSWGPLRHPAVAIVTAGLHRHRDPPTFDLSRPRLSAPSTMAPDDDPFGEALEIALQARPARRRCVAGDESESLTRVLSRAGRRQRQSHCEDGARRRRRRRTEHQGVGGVFSSFSPAHVQGPVGRPRP
jgi:hypothetical protein